MNDSRIFLFLVGVLFSISANAQTRSILFIGNSYTYGNNMPAITASMAQSTGKTLNYDSHTPGGEQLASHASSTIVEDKLDDQDWDFVAIQGQSQEMSWPLVNSSSQMASCATLSQKARTAYSCVVPLFYMTWGRENGDAQNCGWQSYLCTYEGMDDTLQANYTRAATQNNGAVSPVAKVWRYLRANTSLDLYASDGSHASYAGSYAVAATFYTMIFQADPESVTFYGSLSAADAQEILSAVKLIVYDDLEDFFFTTSYCKYFLIRGLCCSN